MIPAHHTRVILDDELPGAYAWAARHHINMQWRPDELELRVTLKQHTTQQTFYLRGRFDNYRAIAPEWTFTDENWTAAPSRSLFPNPAGGPVSSIFHTAPVLCVPFNRLAYQQHGGPHGDWGPTGNWLSAGLEYVHAETVGDMLQVIWHHFALTTGRMGA